MLAYLLDERAPYWSSLPKGAYVGLTREHRTKAVSSAGNDAREIRATDGLARSPFWRQLMADTLGLVASIDVAADLLRIESTVLTDPAAAEVYAALRPVFADLYAALLPSFSALRELAPSRPPPVTATRQATKLGSLGTSCLRALMRSAAMTNAVDSSIAPQKNDT